MDFFNGIKDIAIPLVGMAIPLAALALAGIVSVAAMVYRHRSRELRHQTIRMALEKGQPLPAELLNDPERRDHRPGRDLRRGIIITSVGIGLSVFLGLHGNRSWTVGFILIAIGAGFVIAHFVVPRLPAPDAEKR